MSANSRILVIGGGISGITAAVEASEAGSDVLLVEKNPYLGGRDFQSDDLQERFDTKFQEVILRLEPKKKNIPLGLNVMAELAENR